MSYIVVSIPIDLGYGLTEWLYNEHGISLLQRGREWHAEGHPNPQSIIDQYNPWPTEKPKRQREIDELFTADTATLMAAYPDFESVTWARQEKEARAFLADNSAVTPMLSIIATVSGQSVADLAAKVVQNADNFHAAIAVMIGKRYKARAQIDAMPDVGQHERIKDLWAIKYGE